MKWLALDIGGANLKSANGRGFAASHFFPLWQKPDRLAEALRTLIAEAPESDHLAVTMTGELADCYQTKTEGVERILDAVEAAADHRHSRVYLTDGRLVSPTVARTMPLLAAASNWHALARFAGRYAKQGLALMLDIGSTTSDFIPLRDGQPEAMGQTDPDRLLSGELLYTGVERSPVCGVARTLPWRGKQCPAAHELFATTLDAYLVLNELSEQPNNKHTADGRPATKEFAEQRLARMLCADANMFSSEDAVEVATAIRQAQLQQLNGAWMQVLERMSGTPTTIIVSGRGEFLARTLIAEHHLSATIVSLREELGGSISRCAPAHALAVLAAEAG